MKQFMALCLTICFIGLLNTVSAKVPVAEKSEVKIELVSMDTTVVAPIADQIVFDFTLAKVSDRVRTEEFAVFDSMILQPRSVEIKPATNMLRRDGKMIYALLNYNKQIKRTPNEGYRGNSRNPRDGI